jgi:signal transduction histidine kinase
MKTTTFAFQFVNTQVQAWLKLVLAVVVGCLLLVGAHIWNLSLSSGDFGSLAEGKITILRSATMDLVPDHDTAAAPSRQVSLPDRVDNRTKGHVHYRITLPVDNSGSSENALALCVPRWSSNATVWLNGRKLLDLDKGNGQLAVKELNRAGYLALPPGLPAGEHRLDIRLRVMPGTIPGLSEIWFGDSKIVSRECDALQDINMGARIGGLYLMIFLTLVATGIAFYQPDALARGFALLGFFWCLHSMVLLDWIPHAQETTWLAWLHITRPLQAIAGIWVALHLTGKDQRPLKWCIAIVSIVGYAIFPFLSIENWNLWLVVLGGCLMPLIIATWLKLVWHSAQSVYLSDFTFTVAMFFGIGVNVMDVGRNKGLLPYSTMSLTYLVVPVLSLAIGFLVLERLQGFMRRQAESARMLEQKLHAQKIQLAATHKALQEQREKILLNEERQRMVRDMHDGLGTQLVSASALLKSGARQDAQSGELSELIDHALLDLRSLLDVFSSTTENHHQDDDTVSLLLSMLRHRLTPVFRAQGIHLDWDGQPLPPQFLPEDRQRLQLLRLLQEACANIIKHAHATRVTMRTQVREHAIVVEVQDDGQGMEAANTPSGPKSGHGLNNMSVRAAKLGAELVIESTASGTCVRLIFPRPAKA